ncbi:hypothetical protein [Pseudomonas putida]|uniref:N-acetyltransferase n=1 Tax=Pseudomonas putida TaxID=303 RepID=A0ABD7BLJ9_PSEPU|nr:hypothetical protein [Pseudomonas putida]QOD01489.1 hypothetical protein ID616_30160 [Pseudomonas putida]
MSLKYASNQLEQCCHLKDLFVFEHQIGHRREVIPVVTEYTRTTLHSGPQGEFEFFRARAAHRGASGSIFHTWHNQVSVTVCHQTKQVKFGPTGQLIMNKRGIGLGPALMACVITWLQKHDVLDYTIDPGSLSEVDAKTVAAREQRNRFYMAFGFELSTYGSPLTGLDVVEGTFTAANVLALKVPERYQNRLKPIIPPRRNRTLRNGCVVRLYLPSSFIVPQYEMHIVYSTGRFEERGSREGHRS